MGAWRVGRPACELGFGMEVKWFNIGIACQSTGGISLDEGYEAAGNAM